MQPPATPAPGAAGPPAWRAAWPRLALAAALAAAVFAALALRPAADMAAVRGVYEPEAASPPWRWTASRVDIPLAAGGRPAIVALRLGEGGWEGKQPPSVTIEAAGQPPVALDVRGPVRRFAILAPPSAGRLLLRTSVSQATTGDRRWLGVQLHDLSARPLGPPLAAAGIALAAGLLAVAAAALWGRLVRPGWGPIALASALGLGLRLYQLDRLPAGFFQDEAVSLLDAWNVLTTGRDHLGNWLPLGAFESFGDWVSPLMTYCEVPFVALLGTTPLAGRLVVALASALVVPAVAACALALDLPRPAALAAALVAAVSPWEIVRARVAGPPSMAVLPWTLCLLAALWLLRRGGRREALLLALAAGLGLYSYPTMKLAVPLLVALAVLAAWARAAGAAGGRWWPAALALARRWWPAALLLAALWLPFAQLTLLNDRSGMRVAQKLIRADSAADWAWQWAASYATYLRPEFYYVTGDGANGMPDQGVQLLAEAPLVLLGLGALLWRCARPRPWAAADVWTWRLALGALVVAPLPASVMTPNPHMSRALIVAPVYALLAGCGAAALMWLAERGRPAGHGWRGAAIAGAVAALVLWQGALRYQGYLESYPEVVARKYQDGLWEAAQAAVADAPGYDEVWVEARLSFPYVYILAAHAYPPAESQAAIVVERPGTTFNTVTRVGKYRFVDLTELPRRLPTLEAFPTSLGTPGYVLQEWQDGGRRVLLLRRG